METGHDIIFFWVARMIMQGIAMMDDIPFSTIYLHGMVRVDGEKMSKMKGNVKDPVDLIETYGTDAMRLGLVVGSTPGNDVSISDAKMEAQRNFVNKLWNAGRFVLNNVTPDDLGDLPVQAEALSLADRWIRSRAEQVTAEATRMLEDYQFGEAARTVQEFLWEDYCDWYLEVAKVQLRDAESAAAGAAAAQATRRTLVSIFERVLKLLHPFAPFATEEIWQSFAPPSATPDGSFKRPSLMVAAWPAVGQRDLRAESEFGDLIEMVQGIRRLKTDYRVGSQLTPAQVAAGARADLLRQYAPIVRTLARVSPLEVAESLPEAPPRALSVVAGGVTVYLPVEGLFDVAQETARVEKEHADASKTADRTAAQLSQPSFTSKAPPAVVEQRRAQLAEQQERVSLLAARLATLRALGA
jgi:valyl-tRNA synthetase